MLIYQCPHCGKKSQVSEQYGGQMTNCTSCGNALRVPRILEETPPGRDHTPLLERVITTIFVEGITRSIYFLIGFGFAMAPLLHLYSPFRNFRIDLGIAIGVGVVFAAGGQKFVDGYIKSRAGR